jgi:hypothetical protein
LDGDFSIGPRFGSDKHGRDKNTASGACQEENIIKALQNEFGNAS